MVQPAMSFVLNTLSKTTGPSRATSQHTYWRRERPDSAHARFPCWPQSSLTSTCPTLTESVSDSDNGHPSDKCASSIENGIGNEKGNRNAKTAAGVGRTAIRW